MKYDDEVYTPGAVIRGLIDLEDALKEISRLRKVVRERARRLAKADPESQEHVTETLLFNLPPTIKEIRGADNVSLEAGYALATYYTMLGDPMLSLSARAAQRKRLEETAEAAGFVKPDEKKAFGDFMDWTREFLNAKMYDSERVKQWYKSNAGKFHDQESLERAFLEWQYTEFKRYKIVEAEGNR